MRSPDGRSAANPSLVSSNPSIGLPSIVNIDVAGTSRSKANPLQKSAIRRPHATNSLARCGSPEPDRKPRRLISDRLDDRIAHEGLAGLANGLDRRAARHGRALASPMAPAPLDPTLNSNTSRSSQHHGAHSDTRRPDGRGESSLGGPSH